MTRSSVGLHDQPPPPDIPAPARKSSLSSNRNLHLDTRLDVDDDLLHNLCRRVEVDQPLVNSHLEHIPCLRTFTAGCFSGRDLEGLSGEADWPFDAQVLGLRTLEQLGAHLFEGGDFAARQGDADLVDFLESRLSVHV